MGRIRKLAFAGSALLAGLTLGGAATWFVIGRADWIGQMEVDGWTSNRLVGSTAADPYTRAIVARRGLLALSRQEAAYFQRFTDADGQPFNAECTYRMEGRALPARWWAITLYADDDFLPRNGLGAYSLDATQTAQAPGHRWVAALTLQRPADTPYWISTKNSGRFLLTLRLYHPDLSALERAETLELPQVRKVSCA